MSDEPSKKRRQHYGLTPVMQAAVAEIGWRTEMNRLGQRKQLPLLTEADQTRWLEVYAWLRDARHADREGPRGPKPGTPTRRSLARRGYLTFALEAYQQITAFKTTQGIWERVGQRHPELCLPPATAFAGGVLASLFEAEATTWETAYTNATRSYSILRALGRAEAKFKALHAQGLGIPPLTSADVTGAYDACLAEGRPKKSRDRVEVLARLYVAQTRAAHLGTAEDAMAWRVAAKNMRVRQRMWARLARLARRLQNDASAYLKVSRDARFERLPRLFAMKSGQQADKSEVGLVPAGVSL